MKITPIRINPHPGFLKIRIQTNQVGWISNSAIKYFMMYIMSALFMTYLR